MSTTKKTKKHTEVEKEKPKETSHEIPVEVVTSFVDVPIDVPPTQPEKETASLSVPIAIIIAGLFVAGSILYTGSRVPEVPKSADYTAVASQLKKGSISADIGLDRKAFLACVASGKYTAKIQASVDEGIKAGVTGTPFPIVVTKSGTKFVYDGRIQMPELIANALAGKTEGEAKDMILPPVTASDHILGNPNAEVFIVEYSDTECPYSKMFHANMINAMAGYEKEGKVAWVYRHFPLDMHPKARKEAEATECAFEQGGSAKFWQYIDLMFKVAPSNNKLDEALL